MSREKECECCHEWWYASDVKENLCPNCYYYFKQLKQQLEEKDKEIDRLKDFIGCKGCVDVIKKSNKDQTQLAIQELEKVTKNILDTFDINYEHWEFNHKCLYKHKQLEYYDIIEMIDNQIKELKGE